MHFYTICQHTYMAAACTSNGSDKVGALSTIDTDMFGAFGVGPTYLTHPASNATHSSSARSQLVHFSQIFHHTIVDALAWSCAELHKIDCCADKDYESEVKDKLAELATTRRSAQKVT